MCVCVPVCVSVCVCPCVCVCVEVEMCSGGEATEREKKFVSPPPLLP